MQINTVVESTAGKKNHAFKTFRLQQLLIVFSLVNLLIVSLLGVLLRAYPFFDSIGLSYKNIMHGHSHFAFGGWIMPAILALLLRCFPQLEETVSFRHWRNVAALLLVSAYGMLLTFPLQGYKAISIGFSTLSIVAGYYLTIVIWKAQRTLPTSLPLNFLKWGLFYFILSSLGPFATGPLIALGKTGTKLYYDVIYFYLHFQYNGWFVFVMLALFYQHLEGRKVNNNGRKVLRILNDTCLPTYFLSVLWHQPPVIINVMGGLAAAAQLYAAWLLIKDLSNCSFENNFIKQLLLVVFVAFIAKLILQVFSALPAVALMAYQYRNFVIAYLHLVLLGCISLFLLLWMMYSFAIQTTKPLRSGLIVFLLAFVFSELLIIGFPLGTIIGFTLPHHALFLFLVSVILPIAIFMFGWAIVKQTKAYYLPHQTIGFKLASL